MKRFGVFITVLTVLITVLTGCGKAASPKPEASTYAGGLFDTSKVHTIDIHFLPGEWEDLLENAEEKTK